MRGLVLLCLLNVVLRTFVRCDDCDTPLSDNTVPWKQGTNGSGVTVSLSAEKVSNACKLQW